jgi:hypothetical protein
MPWIKIYLQVAIWFFALIFIMSSIGAAAEFEEKIQKRGVESIDVAGWMFSIPRNKAFAFFAFWGLETVSNILFSVSIGIIWPVAVGALFFLVMTFV